MIHLVIRSRLTPAGGLLNRQFIYWYMQSAVSPCNLLVWCHSLTDLSTIAWKVCAVSLVSLESPLICGLTVVKGILSVIEWLACKLKHTITNRTLPNYVKQYMHFRRSVGIHQVFR